MAASLRDLKVWQESVALAGDLTRALRQATRRETKAFSDHMMLTASRVAERIAEGQARYESAEQREIYWAAKRDLLIVETHLGVARHAELLSATTQAALLERVQLLHRLIAGYLVYLDRQIIEEKAPRPANVPAGK